ncbi:MAG: tRNA lysidine(34) synthetase TilS [Clostridia bacterium]
MAMKIQTLNNKKIGVAVSGGIDSMTLLDMYIKAGQDIVVINIEHGLRGNESINDSQFVVDYCKKNNIECWFFAIETKKEAKIRKESTELTARLLRYEIFDNLIKEKKVDRIALAHHSNDNMETILMRIFRGTGVKGLCGIVDRDKYIHPLIEYSREQIENYAKANKINYVEDKTNFSSKYNRNYIRNKVVPIIKKRFGDVEETFTRLSKNASEVESYLETQIIKARKKGDKYYLDNIFEQHNLIIKYSVQKVLFDMGITQNIEMRHYNYIYSLAKKPMNTIISLPYEVICVKTNDGLVFCKERDYSTYSSQFFMEKGYSFAGNKYKFVIGDKIVNGISFDLDKLPSGCVVRTRLEGDKFKRVNGHSKLLSDYLNSIKMNVLEKRRLLLLASGSEIYAILGVETNDKVKVDDNTKTIIHIIKEK